MKISKIFSILLLTFTINLLSTTVTLAEDEPKVLLPHVHGFKHISSTGLAEHHTRSHGSTGLGHVHGLKHMGSTGLAEHHNRTHLPQHFETDLEDMVESVDSSEAADMVEEKFQGSVCSATKKGIRCYP